MLQKKQLLWGLVLAVSASAQSFEVASVKVSKTTGGRFTMSGGPGTGDPGRISYMNVPLRRVLLVAYDYRNYQITGPDWLDTLRFDINATVPAGASKEAFQAMLQELLAKRFLMTTRRETKEIPIYMLVVAKGGAKVKPTGSGAPAAEEIATAGKEGKDGFPVVSLPGSGIIIETKDGRRRVTVKDSPLSKFADTLVGQVGRPVMDGSGLPGNFTFELYFAPEGMPADAGPEPSIFGAIQEQLGLRLEARKGAVEFLVIDHAEKVPIEN